MPTLYHAEAPWIRMHGYERYRILPGGISHVRPVLRPAILIAGSAPVDSAERVG